MARLFGIDIPGNKKVEYALRSLYGIGPSRARDIVASSGLDSNLHARDLNETQLSKLSNLIDHKKYVIEGDLRQEIAANIKRLQAIRCYRGMRHSMKLPVRGQRTQTNARTRKGGRKTVGVIRKK